MRLPASLLTIALLAPVALTAQEPVEGAPLEARVWLDRAEEAVLHRGEDVRVYYRTSFAAYTAVFRIDTDGRVSLLLPAHPGAANITSSERDYRLVMPGASRWEVRDDPGVGYFFIVAAPQQLDFSTFRWVPGEARWDLGSVGARVYEDPYLAIDDFVAALIPNWDVAEYTLDFLSYDVGASHDYPRFLCYDCHDDRPYSDWNPYTYACTSFRVVIWEDPYFYPVARYSGTRVVFTVPLRDRPGYTMVARAPGDGWSPVTRRRSAPPASTRPTQFKEPAVARGGGPAPPPRRPSSAAQPTRTTMTPVSSGRTARPRGAMSPAAPRSATPSGRPAAGPDGGASSRPAQATPRPIRNPVVRTAPPPERNSARRASPGSAASTPAGATRPTTSRAAASPMRRAASSRPSLLRRVADAVLSPGSRASSARRPTTARPSTTRPSTTRGSTARPSTRSSGTFRSSPVTRSRPTTPSPTARRPTATPARARPSTANRPPARAAPSRPPARARASPPPRRRGGRGG